MRKNLALSYDAGSPPTTREYLNFDMMIYFAIQILICVDRMSLRGATQFLSTYLSVTGNNEQQALTTTGLELTELLFEN